MLIALTVLGCTKDEAGDSGLDAETQAIVDELNTALEDHESWSQAPEWDGVQPSETVHGEWTEIWFNDAAYSTYEAQAGGDMPDGAIVTKQAYGAEDRSDPLNHTTMFKKDGAWFWASWSPEGDLLESSFDVPSCSGCHASGQDSIMVLTW